MSEYYNPGKNYNHDARDESRVKKNNIKSPVIRRDYQPLNYTKQERKKQTTRCPICNILCTDLKAHKILEHNAAEEYPVD